MSVAPAFENPTRTIFNMNNFESSTSSYLGNKGKQRLIGDLTTNNDTTLNDEVVYGTSNISNLIVENNTTFSREPVINSITASASLTDYNLVSKKYVTDEILKVESNPYPIFFSFGSSYSNTALNMTNASGYVKIVSRDPSKFVLSCIVEISYQLTISSGNSTAITNQHSYTGIYLISYDRTEATTINAGGTILQVPSILSTPRYRLLSGTDMTTTSLPQTIPTLYPISIGLKDNTLAINYTFPNGIYDKSTIQNWTWYSAYGISMRLLYSQPHQNTTDLKLMSPMNDGLNSFTGSMYFIPN